MVFHYLHFDYLKLVFFRYGSQDIFSTKLDVVTFKYLLSPIWPSGSNGEISGAKQTDSHGGETAESARKADRKAPIRKLDLIQTVKELSSF
jgi:hypothetical protein